MVSKQAAGHDQKMGGEGVAAPQTLAASYSGVCGGGWLGSEPTVVS